MIGEIISVAGLATGIFSAVSGIWHGSALSQVRDSINRLNARLEHLSPGIDYLPETYSVRESGLLGPSRPIPAVQASGLLAPASQMLGGDIVSSAMVPAPQLLSTRLSSSASDVLLDIQPFRGTADRTSEDLVPILFEIPGRGWHVGWQKKGVLPFLLGIDYVDAFHRPYSHDSASLGASSFRSPEERFGCFLSLRYGDAERRIAAAMSSPGNFVTGSNGVTGRSFFNNGLTFWLEAGSRRIYNIDLHANGATEASSLLNDGSSGPHAMLGRREAEIKAIFGRDCRVMDNLEAVDILMYDSGGLNERTLMPAPISAFFSFPKMHDACARYSATWYDFRR